MYRLVELTLNLYEVSPLKILAVMYGTSEESDASCVKAVDETDLSAATRYLASDSHLRLLASLPPSFEPQFKANGGGPTKAG